MKENIQNQLTQSIHLSDARWKACLAAGGREKRRFHYCTDASGTIVSYLPHWMCVQSAFYHQLKINTWRSKFEQETDSILLAS